VAAQIRETMMRNDRLDCMQKCSWRAAE